MMTSTATTDAALDRPLHGATFGQAISRFFTKYATFSGRASRSEFWWWYLASAIVSGALSLAMSLSGGWMYDATTNTMAAPSGGYVFFASVLGLWGLATFIPWIALSWRRLHDSNRPGPWWFIGLIPIVGGIILLVFFLMPSDPAGARFDR
jgi:uncharacterized membrane protein YhaH (DUF805 family)